MKNNSAPPPPPPLKTNVVYKFSCPYPHREAEDYIGLTTTTLNRRIGMHVHSGSIKRHFEEIHQIKPSKSQIIDNTSILTVADTRQRLYIKEALLILHQAPKINRQYDNFTNILNLYKSRNSSNMSYQQNHISRSQADSANHSTNVNHSITPQINNPTPSILNQASPQITLRINQLLAGTRNTPSSDSQSPTQNSPIANRLRSSNQRITPI